MSVLRGNDNTVPLKYQMAMKRRRREKEKWEDFEARVGIKRSGGGKKEAHVKAVPNILVQRMSSTASGLCLHIEALRVRQEESH